MVLRDWLLHWVRSSGDRISTRKKGLRRRDDVITRDDEAAATSAGCMCAAAAVFHIFDTHHHLHFPLNHHRPSSSSSSSAFLDQPEEREIITPSYTKGVEAPRNSLEVEDTDSNSVAVKEEQDSHLHFPIQIKTKVSSSSTTDRHHDLSSECSSSMINSPATAKTPSLVARLMGLDLLPEECSSSPSLSSCSNSNAKKIRTSRAFQTRSTKSFFEDDISIGARSLPETPRESSARRSDVHEYYRHHHQQHHRLSLNEERKGRFRMTQSQDENRVSITSPRHYAKQILKNVKESVMSRKRVGQLTDITNTNMDRETRRRDQNLIFIKPTKNNNNNKASRILDLEEKKCTVTPPSTCSPKLRFLETTKNNSKYSASSGTKSPRLLSSSSSSDHKENGIDVINQFGNKKVIITSKTSAVEGNSAESCNNSSEVSKLSTHAMKCKKEEQFVRSIAASKGNLVDKKCKKTPLLLPSDVLRIKQVKKDPCPSPTKLPQKQVSSADALTSKRSTRLSSKPSHSPYSNNNKISSRFPENVTPLDQDRSSSSSTALHGGDAAAEYGKYIQLILKRACITKRSNKWHSPGQPIDPFIFYHLELFHYGGGRDGLLSHRCNRKLIFQLMNELLAHIMIRDTDNICRLGLMSVNVDEGPLIDELCRKIDDFPAAKCEVLEDIDRLIDTDMCKWEFNKYCDVELESIVSKIEGEMVELLVQETVVVVMRNDIISC